MPDGSEMSVNVPFPLFRYKNVAVERQTPRTAIHGNAAVEAVWIGARLWRRARIKFEIVCDE
jgi:hypothetical protein